jgi:methionine-rich copper-binding protein CopC
VRTALSLAILLALVSCRKDEPPAPETSANQTAAPSTATAPQDLSNADVNVKLPLLANAVARCEPDKTRFAAGETVRLTIDLNEAPEGLQVAARVIDADDKEVAHVRRPGAGQKTVAIAIEDDLAAGTYRLEGYWGGNLVCEHTITIGR